MKEPIMSKHYAILISLCVGFALLFFGLNSAQANLIDNPGAELGLTGWSVDESDATAGTGPRIVSTMSYTQTTGDVTPNSGSYFFSFAGDATNATDDEGNTIFMSQTDTTGLSAPTLVLSGYFQTETLNPSDKAEAVLSVWDNTVPSAGSPLATMSSGPLTSTNLEWTPFEVELPINSLGALSWLVELQGTADSLRYTNVFFDDVKLDAVPIPSTLLLFGTAIFALLGIRKRFKG